MQIRIDAPGERVLEHPALPTCSVGPAIVQRADGGAGSKFPRASLDRTTTAWSPSASPVSKSGVAHGAKSPAPSTLHANVAEGLLAEKVNSAVVEVVTAGWCEVIVVVGATVSMVQVQPTATGSTLPSSSVARTDKRWLPTARPESLSGLLHASPAVVSSWHRYAEPGLLEENVNVAVVWFVTGGGPETMDAPGGAVSTFQDDEAGADTLPAESVAIAVNT